MTPPLSSVEEIVSRDLESKGVQNIGGEFIFEDGGDITSLRFIHRDIVIDQFHMVSIAEIETVFNPKKIPQFSPVQLGWLNSRASFGAFYLVKDILHLKSQFSVYANEPAEQMLADFILQTFGTQQSFGFYETNSKISDVQFQQSRGYLNMPRSWPDEVSTEEFEVSANNFNEIGYFSNAGNGGLVLEVILSGDKPTRLFNPYAQTALLRVATDVPHPLLGAGYLSTIALPINPSQSEITEIATSLNQLEFQQDDFIPRIGAWGVRLLGQDLVYSSFIPTGGKYGALHQTLMNWNIQRTIWIRDNYWDSEKGVVIQTSNYSGDVS